MKIVRPTDERGQLGQIPTHWQETTVERMFSKEESYFYKNRR